MRKYRIVKNLDSWLGNQIPDEENTIITEKELWDLARSWDKDVDTLMEDLEIAEQEFAVYDKDGRYVGDVTLNHDEDIDEMEPVWDLLGIDYFPDKPNEWFHLDGGFEDIETSIIGYDGVTYATIKRKVGV